MDLTVYEVERDRCAVRPAPRRRAWMDETPASFAYRCLPLVMANTHGWEMLCPFAFEVEWDGGADLASVVVHTPEKQTFVASHFAGGTVTFNPLLVVRTAPGFDLWVTGPTNSFKDGAQGMTALIEADWMPYSFTMNWKLTRPGHRVRFEKDEPFCFFFPIARGAVDACEPQLQLLSEDPELQEQYGWVSARRELDRMAGDPSFLGWYTKGERPKRGSGDAPDDHRTGVVARPFTRRAP